MDMSRFDPILKHAFDFEEAMDLIDANELLENIDSTIDLYHRFTMINEIYNSPLYKLLQEEK